jgi:hypothetical protein
MDVDWYESQRDPSLGTEYTVLRCDMKNLFRRSLEDNARRLIVNWSSSISALPQVNKQLYEETLLILYSTPTFYLQSLKDARRFMKNAERQNALKSVASLSLGLQSYGQPMSARNMVWVKKSYEATATTISDMAERMPHVKKLSVIIDVHHQPLAFTFREVWVLPYLNLSKFKEAKEFKIKIQTPVVRKEKTYDWLLALGIWRPNPRSILDSQMYIVTERLQELFSEALTMRIQGFCEACATKALIEETTDDENPLCRTLRWLIRRTSAEWIHQAIDWSWVDHGDA